MNKILNFIHGFFLWTFTLITLICIDLPLKIILCVLILVLGLVSAIFYPLIKRVEFPGWFYAIYDYATTKKYLLARSVHKLWQ
jgi:hypothetical protein